MEPDRNGIGARETTNLLPQLAAFVAVVAAGSFTKAARRSGLDKSLLSRRVQALEHALGVRLLQRTTRRLSVTDAGSRLYDQAASPLLDALGALIRANGPDQVRGTVRVATLPTLAAELVQVAAELRADHPGLLLDIRAADRLVDLIDGGFDLALRTGNLPDSTLVGRRIASWRYVLCASPAWLKRHRHALRNPSALAPHWLLYAGIPRAEHWRFERGSEGTDVEMRPVLATDNSGVQLSAARESLGVTALPPFVARPDLEAGLLVRVLPTWRISHTHSVWLVTPHRDYTPARVSEVLRSVETRVRRLDDEWKDFSD